MARYSTWIVHIDGKQLTVEAAVSGEYRPPTTHSAAEYPEIDNLRGVPEGVDPERVAEAVIRQATELQRRRR